MRSSNKPISSGLHFANSYNMIESCLCGCGYLPKQLVYALSLFFIWVFDLLFIWGPVNVTESKEAIGMHIGYGDTLLLRADGDSRGMTIVGFAYGAFGFSTIIFVSTLAAFSSHSAIKDSVMNYTSPDSFNVKLMCVCIVTLLVFEITKLILYCTLLPDLPTLLGLEPLQPRVRQPALWFNVLSLVLSLGPFLTVAPMLCDVTCNAATYTADTSLTTVKKIVSNTGFAGQDYSAVNNPRSLGRSRSLNGNRGLRSVYVPAAR